MKALLIIAHGSRKTESNDETRQLNKRLQNRLQGFNIIGHAFLELVEPNITQGIELLIKRGAKTISVLPYFLAKGNHVARDIPQEIKTITQSNPDIIINVLPHIGSCEGMVDLVAKHINQ